MNQNPGSGWLANGRRAFPGTRCAELLLPFALPTDSRGRLDLHMVPIGLTNGLRLHALGAVLVIATLLVIRWAHIRPSPAAKT